ncbi:transcription termination factor MTERF8, chloroplastic-like isoform X2 [Wolffia australiana]
MLTKKLFGRFLFSTSSSSSSSLIEFLIRSCGFAIAEAAKVSSSLPAQEDLSRAEQAVVFLRTQGFTSDQIRRSIVLFPALLRKDLTLTLEPRIRLLQSEGFSAAEISRFISANPSSVRVADLQTKLRFWRTLTGSNEKALKVLSESHVVNASLDRKIKPNVCFLRNTGLSDHRIGRILARRPRLVACRLETIRALVAQVESHGVSASTGMFEQALYAMANLSKSKLEEKLRLFLSFGWSEEEFLGAFQRSPLILRVSEKKIKLAMEFLINQVGVAPGYVALRPVLLSYSLGRRLVPRQIVLKILKSEGISAGEHDFLGIVVLPEEKFLERSLEWVFVRIFTT